MEVTYMNGAGNDFMVIDARGMTPDFASLAKACCAVTGADGFMAVDHSDTADFRLHFYNSDGSRGEMCGNGARCICRYAYDKGICGPEMTVQTDAGLVRGWHLEGERFRIQLNNPTILELNRKPGIAYVELGNPGIPHAVAAYTGDLWADADSLREQMRALRFDPAFPKGANVNFYQRLGKDEVRVLTFERGVEDFTLACGTGCGSLAAVLYRQTGSTFLTAHNRGGDLCVRIESEDGIITGLFQEGPTQVVRIYDL